MNARWAFWWLLILQSAAPLMGAAFSFDDVDAQAKALSQVPFQPSPPVPKPLSDLKFSQYASFHFKDEYAWWGKDQLPYCLKFFVPGYLHKTVVGLHEIDNQSVRDIPFDNGFFQQTNASAPTVDFGGYSGFRILRKEPMAEFAEFQDASYFRMAGWGQYYGTSARGLALNTIGHVPEEFPVFKEFWIQRPEKDAREIKVLALMDSPSVTGAYEFEIVPGAATVAQVRARLFSRKEITEFGMAPLSSMFYFDENSHPAADRRPQVHDASGLLIQNGRGEWIWRPLEAGKMTRVDAFQDTNPKGFGLMQRDRSPADYQDPHTHPEIRPNAWIEPKANWGEGEVDLIQLPADREFADNIVAYWKPSVPPTPEHAVDFRYEIRWTTNNLTPASLGFVEATHYALTAGPSKHVRFVIEFAGVTVATPEKLDAEVVCGDGATLVSKELIRNDERKTWRLVMEIAPRQTANLQAFLHRGVEPVTETWNFTWHP